MKKLWLLLILFFAHPAYSAGMNATKGGDGFCNKLSDDSAICYEWILVSDPDIHFVAYGYEDGIEYDFKRKLPKGKYETILRIHPVIKDESLADTLFWGYPWDITDIVLPTGKANKAFLTNFDHAITDDCQVCSPSLQTIVPAVLFSGHTTQPQMTVPLLKFEPTTLRKARSRSGR